MARIRYHSPEYRAYLNSDAWKAKRRTALEAAHWCCQRCGMPHRLVRLQVHHRTYVRLGNELLQDLQVLCIYCHAWADEKRRAELRHHRTEASFQRWARHQFGEDWEMLLNRAWLPYLHQVSQSANRPALALLAEVGKGD